MLVRLYDLPDASYALERVTRGGATIGRPDPQDKSRLLEWVAAQFTRRWVAETEIAFGSTPPSCFVARSQSGIVGFACHDCTRLNYFGPMGVTEEERGKGIGLALLLSCLHSMRDAGYAYAIIGGVGPADFYAKTVGATLIEGSMPGIYRQVAGTITI